MKNQAQLRLYPLEPSTSTKLVIIVEGESDSHILNIEGWYRVPPNHRSPMLVECREPMCYQCTPLDYGCCVEVKISIKISGVIKHHVLTTQPVRLAKDIKERILYVIQPMSCRIGIDEFTAFVSIQIENKKIKFFNDMTRYYFPLTDDLIDVDPVQNCFRLNFQHCRLDFLKFYNECLRWSPKIRSNVCYCLFNSKFQRDLILYLIADSLHATHQNSKIDSRSFTPRNGPKSPLNNDPLTTNSNKILKNNGSSSSLASNNTRRQKNKEKVKISERLNMKRSYTKLSANKINLGKDKDGECLNIFEDDDFAQVTSGGGKADLSAHNDTAMDLRGSFEEFQQKSFSKLDEDKTSNHSFRQVSKTKIQNPFEMENKSLRQENIRLKKSLENMNQTIRETGTLRKKYESAIDEISRLENQRRAIIMDKVKFQSAYHREVQEKELLKKELENLKQMFVKNQRY